MCMEKEKKKQAWDHRMQARNDEVGDAVDVTVTANEQVFLSRHMPASALVLNAREEREGHETRGRFVRDTIFDLGSHLPVGSLCPVALLPLSC